MANLTLEDIANISFQEPISADTARRMWMRLLTTFRFPMTTR